MMAKQNGVMWIQIVSWYTQKHKDIAKDVETRFDTSNYQLECNSTDRVLPKIENMKSDWINERLINWKNYEKICCSKRKKLLATQWMTVMKVIKTKGTKKCVTKTKLKLENYKNCLQATHLDNKIIQKKVKMIQIVLKTSNKIHKKQQINIKNRAKV